MKTYIASLALIMTAFFISGTAAYAGQGANDASKVYRIGTRLDAYTRPVSFTPTIAVSVNGAVSENVMTTTQRILNKEAPFLKKGMVKPVGEDRWSAWELVSDEGGGHHHQTAPNPLTYYAAGVSSSLLTQVERGIQVLGLDVDDVKVESKIFFRWADTMTASWSGYTDRVVTNVLVESNESPDRIQELKELAYSAWAVGEGLANTTRIDVAIIVNGDSWLGSKPGAGKVGSPVSMDNGFAITNVTPDLKLKTVGIEEDLAVDMGNIPNPLIFSEISIAESAHDPKRPYLHRIRAKSLTENYKTWDLYADDSRGYEGMDKAPSSWDYFTVGTSFCLMSQLTATHKFFAEHGVDIQDFRVEHQFNYQQENFMTPAMAGQLGDVTTRVVVTGDAAEEGLHAFARQALRMCFAGEGIQNETEMDYNVYLNGKLVK